MNSLLSKFLSSASKSQPQQNVAPVPVPRVGSGKTGPGGEEGSSRTTWTAGVPSPPGRPVVELSSYPTTGAATDDSAVTDEIIMTWAVPQDDGGYPITGYRVEMLDLQSGSWIEITHIEGYEPKCTLSNILYGIMYRFRVIAMNDAGDSEPGEPSEPVVIDVPGVQIAPYFVQMLNDTIALEHEKIDFRVRVLGTPKPSIQWFKDDLELFSCDRVELREEEEGGVVVLKGARLSDSGTIKCVATNVLGRAVSTAQLSIEAAPRLELPENYNDGLIFRQDEVIRLKIPIVAKPAPKVVWFFEDEPISGAGADLQIETTETYTSLRIQNAKRWHCGEFRVYAENENGEDANSVLITVTSPPSPPGRPVVMDISETRCTLRWEASDDDGGADVKHYLLEYFRDVWNVWLKALTTKDTTAVIDDLIAGSRYKFRVRAENAYGVSDCSEESDAFDVASGAESVSKSGLPKAPNRKTWTEMQSFSTESESGGKAEELKQGAQKRPAPPTVLVSDSEVVEDGPSLAKTKQMWTSDDPPEEDILDRFLKVKSYAEARIPSYDSDGLPSIAPIDDDSCFSDASDNLPATEAIDAHIKEQMDELRQISCEADELELESMQPPARGAVVGSPIGPLSDDNFATSNESVASLIPAEKKAAMQNFEKTLKEMIQEARDMARTPATTGGKNSQQEQEEDVMAEEGPDLSRYEKNGVPRDRNRSPWADRDRSSRNKSPSSHSVHSIQSTTESVVSVIERRPSMSSEQQQAGPVHATVEDPRKLLSPGEPLIPLAPVRKAKSRDASPNQGQKSVGVERYEELIVEAPRKRLSQEPSAEKSPHESDLESLERDLESPTSFLSAIKGSSSTSNVPKVDTSYQTLGVGIGGLRSGSLTLTRSRPTSVEPPPISNGNHYNNGVVNGGASHTTVPEIGPSDRKPEMVIPPPPAPPPPVPVAAPVVRPKFVPRPIQVSIDPTARPTVLDAARFNGNSSTTMLPQLGSVPAIILPRNLPRWALMTYTYSAVFIVILLIANATPDGRLYIHFTALWSLVLYFALDDDVAAGTDPLESMVEGLFGQHSQRLLQTNSAQNQPKANGTHKK